VMIADLPPSLRGLMVAAFAAAYMSTIATQLNWGASYLVNDFYRRFLKPHASAHHYVNASKVATVLLTIVSAVVTFYLDSIAGAWKMLLVTGAGTGSVLLLRWYWWRINAWSEVSAMVAAFITSITLQGALHMNSDDPRSFAWIMIITVSITTVVWLAATFSRLRSRARCWWRSTGERGRRLRMETDCKAGAGCKAGERSRTQCYGLGGGIGADLWRPVWDRQVAAA